MQCQQLQCHHPPPAVPPTAPWQQQRQLPTRHSRGGSWIRQKYRGWHRGSPASPVPPQHSDSGSACHSPAWCDKRKQSNRISEMHYACCRVCYHTDACVPCPAASLHAGVLPSAVVRVPLIQQAARGHGVQQRSMVAVAALMLATHLPHTTSQVVLTAVCASQARGWGSRARLAACCQQWRAR
jgi:hypothetical protein